MSIKRKLILAILGCMLILATVTAGLVEVAAERAVTMAAAQAVGAASQALAAMERADVEKLDATLRALAAHPGLVAAYAARDRARLLEVGGPIFADLKARHAITHFYVHDLDRTCFLRFHRPEQHGDRVERATLASASGTGGMGAGTELGITAFAVRVVEPWVVDGRVIGYLELGEEVDRFLGRMKAQTGDDYAMLVAKRGPSGAEVLRAADWRSMRAASGRPDDWDAHPDYVVLNGTFEDRAALGGLAIAGLPPGGRLLGEVRRGPATMARGLASVADAGGRAIGALVVLHDITALHDGLRRARAGILLTLTATAALMSLLMLWLVQRLVFARLDQLTSSLEDMGSRLAGGEYDVAAPAPSGPDDEIGRFETFVTSFIRVVGGVLKELTARRT